MVYKDMFFVRVAKHVMCDTGIACLYTALQCQYVHILSLTEPPESIYPLARGKTSSLPKGSAITGIPTPADKAAVQRFLGMCQYLSKFCQNLSQTVLPLRDLTRDDTEFLWSDVHKAAFNSAKTLIASTTALRYYDVSLPVNLQVDASDSAIGRVLLHESHPVCFMSHSLCSHRERVLSNCVLYGEMALLPKKYMESMT